MNKRVIDPAALAAFKEEKPRFAKMPTLEVWLTDWLQRIIRPSCKASTAANYASYIYKHILPLLGDYRLDELEPAMILYFIQHQLQNGRTDGNGPLSVKTVQEYRNMLHLALQKAVEEGYLLTNPCQNVRVQRDDSKEIRTLKVSEQEELAKDIDPTWKPASNIPVLLGMFGGMRIGEIAGLQIRDIDLKERLIHVERSLNRFSRAGTKQGRCPLSYSTTKNGKNRVVPMNDDLYAALSHYLDTMPEEYKKADAPLFITSRGNVMEPRMISYHFHRLMKQHHLEDLHFHCLRHTFATRALEANMNIKVCSKILGHASTQITADIYTHVTMFQMEKEIQKLNMENLQQVYA